MMLCKVGVAGLTIILSACSNEPTLLSQANDQDVEAAYVTAQEQLSDTSFEDVRDTSECTDDCSGHVAGFD